MNTTKKHSGSPAGGSRPKICSNLRNLRFLTLAALALGLCLWLRADTKPPEPDPDPTETQMLTVDGAFETLYPALPSVGLMAKALRLATENLDAAELTVDELLDLIEAYTNAVHQIEIELDPGEDAE